LITRRDEQTVVSGTKRRGFAKKKREKAEKKEAQRKRSPQQAQTEASPVVTSGKALWTLEKPAEASGAPPQVRQDKANYARSGCSNSAQRAVALPLEKE